MKQGPKEALKTAQGGRHVSEKDFSSKKKEGAAAGTSGTKKGSLTKANSLPMPSATSTPAPQKKDWEGSSEDWNKDYNTAKRRGISIEDHEDSARDRIEDAAGERRMQAKETNSENEVHGGSYKRGTPAFGNPPKNSHGFGHPTSARDGHLRNSGVSGAHRIGKK